MCTEYHEITTFVCPCGTLSTCSRFEETRLGSRLCPACAAQEGVQSIDSCDPEVEGGYYLSFSDRSAAKDAWPWLRNWTYECISGVEFDLALDALRKAQRRISDDERRSRKTKPVTKKSNQKDSLNDIPDWLPFPYRWPAA